MIFANMDKGNPARSVDRVRGAYSAYAYTQMMPECLSKLWSLLEDGQS